MSHSLLHPSGSMNVDYLRLTDVDSKSGQILYFLRVELKRV